MKPRSLRSTIDPNSSQVRKRILVCNDLSETPIMCHFKPLKGISDTSSTTYPNHKSVKKGEDSLDLEKYSSAFGPHHLNDP
ncbi:hypothetical protein Tco_0257560 [Tanacetum coccineum]